MKGKILQEFWQRLLSNDILTDLKKMRASLVNITETNFEGKGNNNYKDYDKGICLECLRNSNESSVKREQSARNIQVRNEVREESFMETR